MFSDYPDTMTVDEAREIYRQARDDYEAAAARCGISPIGGFRAAVLDQLPLEEIEVADYVFEATPSPTKWARAATAALAAFLDSYTVRESLAELTEPL